MVEAVDTDFERTNWSGTTTTKTASRPNFHYGGQVTVFDYKLNVASAEKGTSARTSQKKMLKSCRLNVQNVRVFSLGVNESTHGTDWCLYFYLINRTITQCATQGESAEFEAS